MATTYNVQQAIARGYEIKSHNPHYSQEMRGYGLDKPYYDCSSFVDSCWAVLWEGYAPATPGMVQAYTAQGFTHYAYDYNILKRGDILVWNRPGTPGSGNDGHTVIYLGNNYVLEATKNSRLGIDGVTDIRTISSSLPEGEVWQDILRGDSGVYITDVKDFKY